MANERSAGADLPEGMAKVPRLPIVAGAMIICNAVLLMIVATWFIHIMPSLPGQTMNASDLYVIGSAGFIFGALVLFGTMMLHHKSAYRKAWGLMIIVFSMCGYVTGGGFLVGAVLGIVGGVSAIRWKPMTR